jgi:glutathione peroxidase
MNVLKTFASTFGSNNFEKKLSVDSIYDININSLNSSPIDISKFKGKYILIVNVAS